MSDQSLREALEALAADWRSQPADPDSTGMTVMRHCGAQIARALDEHPAEPPIGCPCLQDESGIEVKPGCPEHDPRPAPVQVKITDEAVSAGAERFRMDGHSMLGCDSLSSTEQTVRRILEAAAPLLGPRPLLDRDEVASAVVEAACQFAGSSGSADACTDAVKPAVDTILELARPMPTHKQIVDAISTLRIGHSGQLSWSRTADAVLALLNGAES